MKSQKGYTLVELVTVIVILGILMSVAIPKYIDAGGRARVASLQYLTGSLNSAVGIVKAGYNLQGKTSPVVMQDGTTVAVTLTPGINVGAPLATLSGIGNAVLSTGYVVTYTGGSNPVAIFTLQPNCSVVYAQNTGLATINNITGC